MRDIAEAHQHTLAAAWETAVAVRGMRTWWRAAVCTHTAEREKN